MKMKRRIVWFVFLIVLVNVLTGCNNQLNSDEMKREILQRCTPLAESWFEENMHGAESVTVELFNISWGEVCFEVVTGTYCRNGETHRYYLNVDTGEFYSEEYYDTLSSYLENYITSVLTENLNGEYSLLYFPMEQVRIHGTVVSDQYLNRKRAESEVYEISKECDSAYEMFDPDALGEIALEKLSADPVTIEILVDDAEKMLRDTASFSFLKEHENWILALKEDRDAVLDCRIYSENGNYYVSRTFYDEKDRIQSRVESLDG
ncbi:MAG: hypothetical protein MJ118_01775 [Clostridia bacterium]|nr:hypothetical protein [Clostridia bacterium]